MRQPETVGSENEEKGSRMKINVLKEYAALEAMTPKELLVEWKKYYDQPVRQSGNMIGNFNASWPTKLKRHLLMPHFRSWCRIMGWYAYKFEMLVHS